MVMRPASQFCCGCPLTFGAFLILTLNLVQNVFYIATATSNIILRIPTIGFNTSLTAQTFTAAFCLLGLPFIFSGFWGVWCRLENHIRLYWYYMIMSFALDMLSITEALILNDVCDSMPTILKKHGSAFACGFMRIFSVVIVIQVVCIQAYAIFVIWSLCQDLQAGGGGTGFPELMKGSQDRHERKRYNWPYGEDFFAGPAQGGPAGFPVSYGAFATQGMGGGSRIYGDYHETAFPPAQRY
mmetsp:Transcript_8674/g.23197  ORF Transcript_8674/g.23197 Transcript_8674/m.23197 type:complete len:241 (-) Transcript_8674:71-793(-)